MDKHAEGKVDLGNSDRSARNTGMSRPSAPFRPPVAPKRLNDADTLSTPSVPFRSPVVPGPRSSDALSALQAPAQKHTLSTASTPQTAATRFLEFMPAIRKTIDRAITELRHDTYGRPAGFPTEVELATVQAKLKGVASGNITVGDASLERQLSNVVEVVTSLLEGVVKNPHKAGEVRSRSYHLQARMVDAYSDVLTAGICSPKQPLPPRP